MTAQEFVFEKIIQGHRFEFKAVKQPDSFYESKRLEIHYKVDGYGASDSGWTYGAHYDQNTKTIDSYGFTTRERKKGEDYDADHLKLNGKVVRRIIIKDKTILDT